VDVPPDPGAFAYRLRDGYHWFMASVAAGHTHIPVLVKDFAETDAILGIKLDMTPLS
jgi:hypothetical protein